MGIFAWTGDQLTDIVTRVAAVRDRLRKMPTASHTCERLGRVLAELDSIAMEFADIDHAGTR